MMKEWEAQSDSLLRAMLSKDAFHMSDRGYECLALDLAADLAPRLRQLSTQAIDNSAPAVSIVK
jgi:lysophospholipase L1-like esterase